MEEAKFKKFFWAMICIFSPLLAVAPIVFAVLGGRGALIIIAPLFLNFLTLTLLYSPKNFIQGELKLTLFIFYIELAVWVIFAFIYSYLKNGISMHVDWRAVFIILFFELFGLSPYILGLLALGKSEINKGRALILIGQCTANVSVWFGIMIVAFFALSQT